MNRKKQIAIVDHKTLFRKGLVSLIRYFPDYDVLFDAANGKEFTERLMGRPLPDFVILDNSNHELDGTATSHWIEVNHPGMRILTLSTVDALTAIMKVVKDEKKSYGVKDAEPSDLQTAFDEILSRCYFDNDFVSGNL